MGRSSSSSSSSCLKIIACGSDTAYESDDIDAPEAKVSSDKRGWSFRKRSGRNRVLGNNVSSGTATFADKEIPRGVNADFEAPIKSVNNDEKPQLPKPVDKTSGTVSAAEKYNESKTSVVVIAPENISSATTTESKVSQSVVALESGGNPTSTKSKVDNSVVVSVVDSNKTSSESSVACETAISTVETSESAEPKISESVMASENDGDADDIMDEPVAIIIQTAIRGFLAQRELVQLKSAIKLQAVIRGHLVRRNAVETLHCIRAIVKVQALVRARSSKSLDQKNKPDSQFSTVKLLQNSFARQLLESKPKPKSVNIRCDPLKPNSAWGWLERWMSVSTSEVAQKLDPSGEPHNDNEVQKDASRADVEFPLMAQSDSVSPNFSMKEEAKSLEDEENVIHDVQNVIHDVNTIDSHSSSVSTEFKTEQSHPEKPDIIEEDVASFEVDAFAGEISHTQAEPISIADTTTISIADKADKEIEQPKISMKRLASEELNAEGKKFVYGSRKASNPAFIAAHSKFEELTSAANSGIPVSSSHQLVGAETFVDEASSLQERIMKTNKPHIIEFSERFDSRIHVAGSECGTELSISSTLDSPDRSDHENAEAAQEVKFLEETSHDPDGRTDQDCEAKGISSNPMTDLPSVTTQQGEDHGINGSSVDPVVAEGSPQGEQKVEMNASDLQTNGAPLSSTMDPDSLPMKQKHELNGYDVHIEHGSAADHQAYKSSPEASPKSHMTVPESQGTPSSQVSVKGKRNKAAKSGSNAKRSSLSAGKRSPSNANSESAARSSTEHLPKEHKSGKRRNSFGSTKSDHADQEPRDSSSRNSLPSYMQATESARAKAHSPRSSPDVHDKEVYSKKRHSLPGATGRHGSPRVQHSSSEAGSGAKANGSHPTNERKWQR